MKSALALALLLLAASAARAEPGNFAPADGREIRVEELRAFARKVARTLRQAPLAAPQLESPQRRWALGEGDAFPSLALRHELTKETTLELRVGRLFAPESL